MDSGNNLVPYIRIEAMGELLEDYSIVYRSCIQNLQSAPLPLVFASRFARFEDYCNVLDYSCPKCTFWINGQYVVYGNFQEVDEILPYIIGYSHEIPGHILRRLIKEGENGEEFDVESTLSTTSFIHSPHSICNDHTRMSLS